MIIKKNKALRIKKEGCQKANDFDSLTHACGTRKDACSLIKNGETEA